MNQGNDKDWNSAPQASNTGAANGGGNRNWNSAPQESNTGSANGAGGRNWNSTPQESNTGAAEYGKPPVKDAPEYDLYEIDGIPYRKVRLVSSNSGEARIFEIEHAGRSYALKLYHLGEHPDHEVLERVMNLRGNGMLIDIYAHGIWKDPSTGMEHDYEIMEYCSGGSLASERLTGQDERLEEIAVRMAAAIDYAHANGILHRDVKPANFLFTDESKTRFVLTDWGLAKILDSEGRTVTDSGRTKIYAAPEMYTYIWGTPTYVGTKSDFFSMGMTLLALWMGEGRLIADERKLVDDKKYGRLPYPDSGSISRHLLSLIKALTRHDPDERAGFEEIAKWAKGEIIFNEEGEDDSLPPFRVVFDAENKLIAHSPKELGEMMWRHRKLGKQYLYSEEKIVYHWLMDAERKPLALSIKDILEIHPSKKDQDAGLFKACLLLNPDTVYEGVGGRLLKTQADIAYDLWKYTEEYKKALYNKKDHPLWAYMSAKGLSNEVKGFRTLVRKEGESGVRTIAYNLDPTLPYIFEGYGGKKPEEVHVNTLDDLAHALDRKEIYDLKAVLRPDFLMWVAQRDPEIAGKAKAFIDGGFGMRQLKADRAGGSSSSALNRIMYDLWLKSQGKSPSSASHSSPATIEMTDEMKAQAVIFALLPGVGMDYLPISESKLATPEQIAHKMQHKGIRSQGSLVVSTVDMEEDMISYLAARGKYSSQLSWIQYCNDFSSDDFQKKCAPYDKDVALFKTAAGLNGAPVPLEVDGKILNGPEDVEQADLSGLPGHIQDMIAKWLTLFYQEELNADYGKESYTSRAGRYFEMIYTNLPGSSYAKRAKPTVEALDNAERKWRKARLKHRIVLTLVIILGLLPLLAVVCGGAYFLATTDSSTFVPTMIKIGTWTGIIAGVLLTLAYWIHSDSFVFSCILGIICFVLIKAGMTYISAWIPWIVWAVFAYALVALTIHNLFWFEYKFVDETTDIPINEAKLRAEMGAAFGTRSKLLPDGIPDAYPEDVFIDNKECMDFFRHDGLKYLGIIWVVIALAFGFFYWMHGLAGGEIKVFGAKEGIGLLDGSFSGDVKGTPLDVEFSSSSKGLEAEMKIHYRSGLTQQTMTADEASGFPVVMTKTDSPAITLTIDTAYMDNGTTLAKGSYLNSKGNRQKVNIKKK